jgi:hypothetical protein
MMIRKISICHPPDRNGPSIPKPPKANQDGPEFLKPV